MLKFISFAKNYINKAGISKIMSFKMPMLELAEFDENADSEIFNSVFGSPWSAKLRKFVSTQKKFDSIDSSLNPKNTRRLEQLIIQNAKLYETDIVALSSMNFYSLEVLAIDLTRVESCMFLFYLLKISNNVIDITLLFSESAKLNSSCLEKFNGNGTNGMVLEQSWI